MESQLPQPIRDALVNNEVKSGLRLLAMALSGLIGAGGVSVFTYLFWGQIAAITVGGATLIITALTLIRALKQLGQPAQSGDGVDRELLQALVAMDRRAVLVTQLDGITLAANLGFERLNDQPIQRIHDMVSSEDSRQAISGLLNNVRHSGHAAAQINVTPNEDDELTLIGKRVGNHLVWQVSRQNDSARLRHEKNMVSGWASTVFEKLECGIILEDVKGTIHYANKVILDWLDIEEGKDLSRVQLKGQDTKLIVGDRQRIDVDVTTIPLQAREQGRQVGQFRFIRRLDQMHGKLVPIEREFLIDPIFDAAPIAIAVVDEQANVKEYNQPLKLHPSASQLNAGDSILDIVVEEDREALFELIKFANDGRPAAIPLDVVYSGQPERVGQVFSASIAKENTRYAILYLVDTTQEKSLERQFVQAQKMQAVGQLAGGVAHDFNNLLTAIIGFCDLLLVRHDAGDQSFSDIIQIKQNANRAANLVRQLLAFSRQQTLRPRVLMLTDVLADLSNLIRRLIGETIELKVVHGRDLPSVKVDQGQLEQVIINLAVNARDAMPQGGKLEIRTRLVEADDPLIDRYDVVVPTDYVLIEVEDNGSGIAKSNLNKIFEPFFTTKEVGQGTGLGLATVYGIVKQTGGFVFVESEVGTGTTFLLLLKAHDRSEVENEDQTVIDVPERDLTGKGTILIVEDEDPVRMFARRALENKGYIVLDADSGEQGLEILNESEAKIDLLITDVVMPNMDGPTLVKTARKTRPELPVIFVSGYAEDMFRKNLEAEEFQFLPKPFTLKDLAEKVKTILD
ncbi:response regulator [Kordiimonas aquimaris]|uniref:response regulator n=1 Tax=Kordiimonas aquimaris TaxID=707591 RepID=UPI0021D09E38|nr:response regulator [Kordiimonas aquimaris]